MNDLEKYKKYKSEKRANLPETPQTARVFPSVFFNDGQRKIDYVLVYPKYEVERDGYKISTISSYLSNIKLKGLQIEEEEGLVLDNLVCVKIHAPKPVLNKYTNLFKLELEQNNPNYKYAKTMTFKFTRSIVTYPDINDPVYSRAPETLSGKQPTDYTDAERIYIVNKVLSTTSYTGIEEATGYQGLVTRKILLAVYPLHDSPCKWPKEGPLTDRQLLAKYWANVRYCCTYQPLTIIERYYGSEVAFYFAWLEFYTKMLFPLAILGVACFASGIVHVIYMGGYMNIEREVCNSNLMLCPVCPSDDWCSFIPLEKSCLMLKIAHIMENPVTVLYSTIMSVWGVVFMVTWKRKQAMLKVRWNLPEYMDTEFRRQFTRTAPLTRISSITGNIEYYFPIWQRVGKTTISYLVVVMMLCMNCMAVILVMYYRLNIMYYGRKSINKTFKEYLSLFETITSAFLSFLIMVIFDSFKRRLCQKLTELESHRTQLEFDKSYTIKITVLSFGNTFFPIIYLAFFKGQFYTHPGDETQWTFLGIFRADVCQVRGCHLDLAVQLIIIMVLKNGMRLFTEVMVPVLSVYMENYRASKDNDSTTATSIDGTQWENDFVLVQPHRSFLYSEYVTMVLQYGFTTFFLVSLPLAPLLAFINNIVELRLDALKMLKNFRRMVPRKATGIGEWYAVLQVITVLGAISNPLLIAFGSNFVPRYMYWISHNYSTVGFINSTLSVFSVADYPGKLQKYTRMELSTCLYVGRRNPPWHPNKYEQTTDYWHQFAIKSLFFMILENVCLLFSLFLQYVIPEIPRKVQLKLQYDQQTLLEARLRGIKS